MLLPSLIAYAVDGRVTVLGFGTDGNSAPLGFGAIFVGYLAGALLAGTDDRPARPRAAGASPAWSRASCESYLPRWVLLAQRGSRGGRLPSGRSPSPWRRSRRRHRIPAAAGWSRSRS